MNVLLRNALGEVLREQRKDNKGTLRYVSKMAACSYGHLSDVEKGRKEVSSELLNSVLRVQGIKLSDLLRQVADKVSEMEQQQ